MKRALYICEKATLETVDETAPGDTTTVAVGSGLAGFVGNESDVHVGMRG
jgi:hypothetical protein